MNRVGIIGDGDRFEALVALLLNTETEVVVWRPEGMAASEDLPEDVELVDVDEFRNLSLIFLSLPITSVREAARRLGDVMTGQHCVVHLCRNLEYATLKSVSRILKEETPSHRFGLLSGPMKQSDVVNNLPASGVCASLFPEIQDFVEECLVSPLFRLYRTDDLIGAEVAAAYSRVIAMASGVAAEMGLGESLQATLFARGLAEMGRFVVYRGGTERTTFGLAGAGNLFSDIDPPGSPDYQIGRKAVRTGHVDAESIEEDFGSSGRDLINLVESLADVLDSSGLDLHILETCHLMTSGEYGPSDALSHLMTLPTLSE